MIIDFHTHIFPPDVIDRREELLQRDRAFSLLYRDPRARMVTAEGLLGAMDRAGIEGAVACGFGWKDSGLRRATNEYLLEASVRHAGRLYPFTATPVGGGRGMVEEASLWLDRGMRGIGEVAFYVRGMTERAFGVMDGLAQLAQSYDVPLLLHVNEPVGHPYPGKIHVRLEALYRFVSRHQETKIVLAHWGGGLCLYELMPSVAKVCGMLYYDTAASPFLYRPMIYRIALEIVGPERVLFGSDYPLIAPSRYFEEMRSAGMPEEAVRRILGENASRVLSLRAASSWKARP
jgi:predicted TIM-barrel fold metal-dependent hydrolase